MPLRATRALRPISRRSVLRAAGLGVAAPALAAPFVSSAFGETKTLTIVQQSHFVPAFDTWFTNFTRDWGQKNGLVVTVDYVPQKDISARAAAEIAAKAGHDLFMWNGAGGPHLYRKFLIDVSKLVAYVENKYGKVSVIGTQIAYNVDDKSWSAYPDYYVNSPGMYRKDLWDEIGMTPDSWDDVRIGGAKLKKKGHPVGNSLAHNVGAGTVWRGVLWSYGGALQDESGKHVVLDSKAAVEAVKFVRALYKEAMTNEVLSWDDSSNNKYIDSGVGSYILNALSAYRTAQKINPALADNIFFWKPPKGPVRRLVAAVPNSYGIWKFAKNQEAALDLLKYYADHWVEAFKASSGYNMPLYANIVPKPMPILSNDPTSHPPTKLAVLQTSDEWTVAPGWPGPAWAATDEVLNDFVLDDMMAKTAMGSSTPEEAVKWATQQSQQIFKKWEA